MMAQVTDSVLTGTRESFEYHGNTTIERIRSRGGVTVLRDWILFDSVEEAEAFFHECCSTPKGFLH